MIGRGRPDILRAATERASEGLQPLDDEIEAIREAHAALARLPPDGQWRAIAYLVNRLRLLEGDHHAAARAEREQ